MLCRLTEHIITQVVAEVMILFAVSSICICRQGQRRERQLFPLNTFSSERVKSQGALQSFTFSPHQIFPGTFKQLLNTMAPVNTFFKLY